MTKSSKTFFLYSIGHNPKITALGTLLLKDYANPNLAHRHDHPAMPAEDLLQWASSDPISGTFTSRSGWGPNASINLADLIQFDASVAKSSNQILKTESGLRQEIYNPQTFLFQNVLCDKSAVQTLALWLSVARSEYLTKKLAFRKPKIWLLTGRYLLQNVRVYSQDRLQPAISAGLSPQLATTAGGPPLGGSLGADWTREIEADFEMAGENVWAAQWRLLDTEYIVRRSEEVNVLGAGVLRFGLYPDVTSKGVLRSSGAGGLGGKDGVCVGLSQNYGGEGDIGGIEDERGGVAMSSDRESRPDEKPKMRLEDADDDDRYDGAFQEALTWFQSEIDDDDEDDDGGIGDD